MCKPLRIPRCSRYDNHFKNITVSQYQGTCYYINIIFIVSVTVKEMETEAGLFLVEQTLYQNLTKYYFLTDMKLDINFKYI